MKKCASIWVGRGDGLVGTNSNLVNVGTVIYVVVTRGPILKGIERDRVDMVPCTMFVNNVRRGLETIGLSN